VIVSIVVFIIFKALIGILIFFVALSIIVYISVYVYTKLRHKNDEEIIEFDEVIEGD
jgi:hypothetical protein